MYETLIPTMAPVVLKATLLLIAGFAAAGILRNRPASHRAAVWQAALLAAVLLPALSLFLPAWRIAIPSAADPAILQISVLASSGTGTWPTQTWILVPIWALGFLVVAARTVLGNWVMWQAVKAGSRREILAAANGSKIPIIVSPRIHTPLLWGVRKPYILVPEGWEFRSAAERALVLAHETAHANRRDSHFQFVAQIACAMYWFHPMIWFAAASLRRESEIACDDAVLGTGARATAYADVLLEAASAFGATGIVAPVTLAMARPSQIQSRIRSVLATGVERAPLGRRGAALAVMFALIAMAPLAAMQSGGEDETVYKITSDITPPHPTYKPEPSYTQDAKEARVEGSVTLKIVIDREGRVSRTEIVRGLHPGLDESALETVRTWIFEPARKAGKPVIVFANVEVNFRLL
jgi:TonB family protein